MKQSILISKTKHFSLSLGLVLMFLQLVLSGNLFSQVVYPFAYTGSIVNWVVPPGVSAVRIEALGARGGAVPANGTTGGCPTYMAGDFTLTPGSTIKILVGSTPNENGGGGGSFVTTSANAPLVIAGGGGGAGGVCCGVKHNGVDASTGTSGVAGINATGGTGPGGVGGNGGSPKGTNSQQAGAGGGLLTNGATGDLGASGGSSFISGGAGGASLLRGGFGGGGSTHCSGVCSPGAPGGAGGGGGGYSGGGSTGGGGQWGGGGGGGSYNGGTSQVNIVRAPCTAASYSLGGSSAPGVTITVLYNVSVLLTGSITCYNGSDGVLTATVSGGVPPYTYAWAPSGGFSQIASGLSAGVYTVTATDAAGAATSTSYTLGQPPLLPITANTSTNVICLGETITLTGSGTAVSYAWSGGATDGVPFAPSGTSVFTVTGTFTNGCTNTATVGVTVNPVPVISIASLSSPTVCLGNTITIIPAGAATYTMSPGAMSNSGGAFTITPMVDLTSYSITGTSNKGCLSQNTATTVAIKILQLPTITVTSNTIICSGTSVPLTANGGLTYTWSPVTSEINTIYGPDVIVKPSVTTHFIVSGEDINGCISSAVSIVTVVPTPTLSLLTLPTTICEGGSVDMAITGATEYTWSPAASLSPSFGSSVTASPSVTTEYTIIGFNGGSGPIFCYGHDTIEITVIPKVYPAINPVSGLCFGQSISLSCSGSPANTYSWTPSYGLENTTGSSTIANPTVSTSYTVTVLKGGMCAETATLHLVVNPKPIVNAGKDSTIDVEDGITLIGTGNVEVGFLSPNGAPLSCNYCHSVTVYPEVNTCYTLRGENKFKCASYDDVCINVIRTWDIFIPNAFTPNDDGDNDVFVPLGHGISKIKLTVYDRWGTAIFKSDANHPGWDGRYKEKMSEPGVYVYSVEITTTAGKTTKRTGHITLVSKTK